MGIDTDRSRLREGDRPARARAAHDDPAPVARPDLVPAVRARDAARGLRPSPRAARGEGGRAARSSGRRRSRRGSSTATSPARPCGPRASVTRSPPRSARATCSPPTARRAASRRRRASRRDPERAARHRGAPVLPRRLPPGAVDRVVARPVGRRPPAPGLRLAVPGRRRPDQPRRGAAEHVRELQGHLGAAPVRRVLADAPARVGDRRGHGGGACAVGAAPDGASTGPRRRCPGLLLIGDAAGAVNPFNGEGIAYAIETGEIAADLVHEALITDRPAIAMQYPRVLEDTYGAYFAVGRWFASVIGKPAIMGRATDKLLPRRGIMAFALRAMANLSRRARRRPAGPDARPRAPAREGGLRDGHGWARRMARC